ncbi:hypothetical protein [Faecalibaculum rodentium]|uniref:hypothetical protein n=3 Tax=Faecalibaculum rodentium TaxID=1702221 RepID=UPI0025B78CD9|nr:hypothetical protein [Faecalibaculum rodentium]
MGEKEKASPGGVGEARSGVAGTPGPEGYVSVTVPVEVGIRLVQVLTGSTRDKSSFNSSKDACDWFSSEFSKWVNSSWMTDKEKTSPSGVGEVMINIKVDTSELDAAIEKAQWLQQLMQVEKHLKDKTDPEMALALLKLLYSVTNRPQSVARILNAMVNG